MEKWGLGYEQLREIRPDIVYFATCLQGQTGPRAGFAGFGLQLAAIAGFYHLSGYSPDEPTPPHGPYTDFIAPRFGCFALLSALDYRRRTGHGQMIDLSQYETSLHFLAPAITHYFATGTVAQPAGNRSPRYAPHGAYRCRDEGGNERWIALAVEGDEQWRGLLEVLGEDAGLPRFTVHADRVAQPEEVDRYLGELIAGRAASELAAALQQAGISAYPVQNCADLREDENLRTFGFFRDLDQSECGPMPYDGLAYRLSRTPGQQSAAPDMGEHTDEVLSALLGLNAPEIGRLHDAKVLY
jgi:benzylsuccinate CoA-transferase BbsF subunit